MLSQTPHTNWESEKTFIQQLPNIKSCGKRLFTLWESHVTWWSVHRLKFTRTCGHLKHFKLVTVDAWDRKISLCISQWCICFSGIPIGIKFTRISSGIPNTPYYQTLTVVEGLLQVGPQHTTLHNKWPTHAIDIMIAVSFILSLHCWLSSSFFIDSCHR